MPTAENFHNVNAAGPRAIICVRLSLGDVLQVATDAGLEFGAHNFRPNLPQTLECVASQKIKVRYPGQIENWVIVLHKNANEGFDPSYYDGCV
jgi:hypothetical protein